MFDIILIFKLQSSVRFTFEHVNINSWLWLLYIRYILNGRSKTCPDREDKVGSSVQITIVKLGHNV